MTDKRGRPGERARSPALPTAVATERPQAGGDDALEHWLAWKRLCALGLCEPPARQALHLFARNRFFRYVLAYAAAREGDARALTPEAPDAWHCFETFLRLRNNRAGKSYKEWLFSRTDAAGGLSLDAVQGGATLLMRDVVREHLRREVAASAVSLDAPPWPGRGSDAPSLAQLLPSSLDTLADVERRDMEALAAAEAAAIEETLSRRHRVALLARHLGLSLTHADVVDAAGCGKSQLFAAHREAMVLVAESVRGRNPDETPDTLAVLAILSLRNLFERMIMWGKSENACRRLFLWCEL